MWQQVHASVDFIYIVHQTESLRTSWDLTAISYPAGPQVAKYTLLLFVWPACSISAFSPSKEWPLILLWEGSMEPRRGKRHLAGIIHLGEIQFLAPETDCLVSVWALMMTRFQVSTCVLLHWSVWWSCWEGISNSRTLSYFHSLSALISIEIFLIARCYHLNHLCFTYCKIDVHVCCLVFFLWFSNLYFCIKTFIGKGANCKIWSKFKFKSNNIRSNITTDCGRIVRWCLVFFVVSKNRIYA